MMMMLMIIKNDDVDDDHQQGPEPVAEDQARDVDRHSGSSPPSHRAVSS